ncbi:MAG: imidazolonepropionase [Anaerolineae bacterium SM23_84]|nr:MAG: imidazolonepropionase [Anaerolineae bacterium SM23_84]
MATAVDLVVHGAGQLLTLGGDGPRSGEAMRQLGLIPDGAVAIADGRVVATGTTSDVESRYCARRDIDAAGRVVLPGLVDAHTHPVFAGSRQDEFERRIAGATYLEIMAAGGGIMSTVRATRAATVSQLVEEAQPRLARMLAHGTTTAEAKTGYGLTTADELKCLEAIRQLSDLQPVELVPTFLGAHAVPDEYAGRAEEYASLVINEMLPAVCQTSQLPALFCDVFCDEGAFDLLQTRRIMVAAKKWGLGLKVHADEFAHLGSVPLAAALGAVSVEHLLHTPRSELEAAATAGLIAVLLPGTPFGLGQNEYAAARTMIAIGLPVALGTDLNPGTCYCESMPLIMALACRFMGMTPAEVIVASTVNAAHAIGRGSELGRLQPGFQADLLILNADDYRHLAYRFGGNLAQTVIKKGKVVVSQA